MKMITAILVVILSCSCNGYVVKTPDISIMEPMGIQFSYPADQGVSLVAYHYNIDVPLIGAAAGQYNADVTTATNGAFVLQNPNVVVNPGDTVYYWVHVVANGGGYNLLDQKWTATASATTTPATTTKGTTTIKETQPPTTTQSVTTTVGSGGDGGAGTTTATTTKPSEGGGGGTVVVTERCDSYPCASSCDMAVAPCNGLIFEENWDTFDLSRWQHEITMSGGGNWEFEFYTNNRSNSYVRDNTLFIKPTLTADHYGEAFLSSGTLDLWGSAPADVCTANSFWGCQRTGSGSNYINPVQSARIRTVDSFAFKYGRVEIEAKLPQGDWLWPAMWLLPKYNSYGQWPASGEFDILESRGNADLKDSEGVSHGCDSMGSTLHWGPFYPLNAYAKTTTEYHAPSGTFASDFHTYIMDWTEDSIDFYLDDVKIASYDPGEQGFFQYGDFESQAPGIDNPWKDTTNKMTPFDQEFFLVLNVAVGGTNGFFGDDWTNAGYPKPWSNTSPTAFKDFWLQKNNWYPTWQPDVNNGENAALQVKSIKVWANY